METILMTAAIRAVVKKRYSIAKYGTDEYFQLNSFLEICDVNEVYCDAEHFRRIAWAICPELTGQDECEIFGQKEHYCLFASIPELLERLDLPDCPLANCAPVPKWIEKKGAKNEQL